MLRTKPELHCDKPDMCPSVKEALATCIPAQGLPNFLAQDTKLTMDAKGVAEWVECSPNMHEAVGLIPSIAQNRCDGRRPAVIIGSRPDSATEQAGD